VILSLLYLTSAFTSKTLVVSDANQDVRATARGFLEALERRGHVLTLKSPSDFVLTQYGENLYDNVVLFAPQLHQRRWSVSVKDLGSFVDSGKNLMIIANSLSSDYLRDAVEEFGISLDSEDSSVVDYFSHKKEASPRDILTTNWIENPLVVGSLAEHKQAAPVLYSGLGLAYREDSRFNFPILSAESTGFSVEECRFATDCLQSAGKDTVLVAGMQGRNNARVTVFGSSEMFSDSLNGVLESSSGKSWSASSNAAFIGAVSAWNFHEIGSLRAKNIRYFLQNGNKTENSKYFSVGDSIEYHVDIDMYNAATGGWKPYTAKDLQLEVVMLDPHIRTVLQTKGDGHYWAQLTLPNNFGVYKFMIKHYRVGTSNLDVSTQVSVRPYRHNQYERFIPAAYPYYISAFSMMIGFFIFGNMFLHAK